MNQHAIEFISTLCNNIFAKIESPAFTHHLQLSIVTSSQHLISLLYHSTSMIATTHNTLNITHSSLLIFDE